MAPSKDGDASQPKFTLESAECAETTSLETSVTNETAEAAPLAAHAVGNEIVTSAIPPAPTNNEAREPQGSSQEVIGAAREGTSTKDTGNWKVQCTRIAKVAGIGSVVAILLVLLVSVARWNLDEATARISLCVVIVFVLIEFARILIVKSPLSASYRLVDYKQKERLSWNTEVLELQNLAWVLRAKHEEAALRAQGAARLGLSITVVALFVAIAGVAGIVFGWHTLNTYVTQPAPVGAMGATYMIPENLWGTIKAAATLKEHAIASVKK
jgi:hypothetical protein